MICGMSGTGKSTTAQKVAEQFKRNGVPCYWLHEEIRNHPIRDGEFSKGSLYTLEGMDANVADMYERWENLTENILASSVTHIMEGCFFQSIMRYFIRSAYSTDQIIQYFDTLSSTLSRIDPVLIFLYRPDIKANFEAVYSIRGEWWKRLILTPDKEGYFAHHPYVGDDSIYAMWAAYQELSQTIFNRFPAAKLKLDTSGCLWNDYIRKIVETVGLTYEPPPEYSLESPARYCGAFVVNKNGEEHTLEVRYDAQRQALYCIGFWPYMEIHPIGVDVFEMASFPIEITYEFSANRKAIHISGTYDWEIVGTRMEERSA
jgi:hypothetical protein